MEIYESIFHMLFDNEYFEKVLRIRELSCFFYTKPIPIPIPS